MDEEFRKGANAAKSDQENAAKKEERRRAIIAETINEIYDRLAPLFNASGQYRMYKGTPHGYEGWSPLYVSNIEFKWHGIRRTEKPTGAIQVLLYDHRSESSQISIVYRFVHVPGYKNSAGNFVIEETQDGATYIVSHSVDEFVFEMGRYFGDINFSH